MDFAKLRTHSKFIVCFFLVMITVIAYWKLPSNDFLNFDDNRYITNNIRTQQGITPENIIWAFNIVDFAYWQPITWLSHMLFFQLYGMNPSMHHLMSLFLHIGNTLLLYILFNRITGKLWQSAFIAFIFALHPLNVESVAWASELKNVLSMFFWMLTMLFYVYYTERPGFTIYLMTIFFFALGLMTKPMLVTLPFVLLLLDYWPLNRFKLYQSSGIDHKFFQPTMNGTKRSSILCLILEKIPFLFLSLICTYLATSSVQRSGVVISSAMVPIKLRIANALTSYTSYIKMMIWPHNLAVFYPFPKAIPLWEVAGAALFLICITVLAFFWVKQRPYFAVGWLWYLGTFVPAIGLVQVGLWPSTADRFAYLPLIGLFILISWSVPDLIAQWRYKKWLLGSIAMALILNFTSITYSQNKYWANSMVLFQRAIDVTNDNGIAHQKLGEALSAHGKTVEAVTHYNEALRIIPTLHGAHLNLGVLLRDKGKFNEALMHFSTLTQLSSDSVEAYYEIGVTMEKQNNFEAAIKYYHAALRLRPNSAKIHNNLGTIMARQNKTKDSIFHFNEAIRIDPDYAPSQYNLGKIYANQQNIRKAIHYFKNALKLNPNMTQALLSLSWILASHENDTYRNGEEAINLAERLCKITKYTQPLALDALAAGYAESGKFDMAVLTAQKGLELAKKEGSKELALELKKRLEQYKKGQPYRQKLNNKNESQTT